MPRTSSRLFLLFTFAIVGTTVSVDHTVRGRIQAEGLATQLLAQQNSPCYQFRLGNAPPQPLPCTDRHALDDAAIVEASGLFEWGFEVLVLRPCDSNAVWWVSTDPCTVGVDRIRALIPSRPGNARLSRTLFVTVRGRLSRPSACGHLGAYERLFHIHEVLSARLPSARDCRVQSSGGV